MSIDLKPMSEALEYLPSWLTATLNYSWAKGYNKCLTSIILYFICYSKPACIGGGFASFCQGYVTDYGDIDVFVQDTHLSEFVEMLKKANPLCHLHEYGTKPNPNYPDQYQVYTVWTGAKRTDIQASILFVESSNFLCSSYQVKLRV